MFSSRFWRYSPRYVNVLRLLWLVLIAWYEFGTFYHHISSCVWPDEELVYESHYNHDEDLHDLHPTRILLIADPQVLDLHSYPERGHTLSWLSEVFTDLNLRKSWKAVSKLHPDTTMFIGDMMDNGRADISDEEYEDYYHRYHDIFEMEDNEPVYYVPGNHDIGIGSDDHFSHHAEERYIKHFGALDQAVALGNHTFVLLDAPGLVEEDHKRITAGVSFQQWAALHPHGPIGFVEHLEPGWFQRPIVLITHIPLARPEHSSCGPLRESGNIHQGTGLGYQNTLSPEASDFLLERLRPSAIFSGDDHDYCEFVHEIPPSHDDPWAGHRTVKEVTVKAFSMAMGIRRPGVQLVSLLHPDAHTPDHHSTSPSVHTIHDNACFLPDQLGIYLSVYLPFILFSIVTLIVSNVYRVTNSPDANSQYPLAPNSANLEANQGFADWRSTTPTTMDDQLPLRRMKDGDKVLDEEAGFAPETPDSAATPGTAIFGKPRNGPRPWTKSWSFVVFGRRRRLTIDSTILGSVLSPFVSDRNQLEANIRRHPVGLIRGFVHDVCRVAWPPLALFAVITWWAFR